MNKLLNGLTNATNFAYTENGALAYSSTKSDLLDLFAMGAAMRKRSEEDCILMFRKAYAENPVYALKCLFYIRDIRGGQGERRFFRVCLKDLAKQDPEAVIRNLDNIAEYGRYDDYFCLMDTPVQDNMLKLIKHQLVLDMECKTPSLLAKWLPSENTSSHKTRALAARIRNYLNISHKQYRKTLSVLRARINVLERLMSANRWEEIEFDKIPSKAGLIYKNAFARRDLIKQKYETFAKSENTKVNAKTLYPYEVVDKALKARYAAADSVDRAMVNKYWANLEDYFNGASLNALAVVDTSGSMTGSEASAPINVAISLGLYCAERAGGPFANHYISFASRPQLIKTEGVDFVDKVRRIYETNLVDNTNIEGVFDLLLQTAINNDCGQEDLPKNIIILSDMQFDSCAQPGWWGNRGNFTAFNTHNAETLLEGIGRKWQAHGYQLPHLIFWNLRSTNAAVPMLGNGPISYVSGFSPSIFQTILTGKTGYELMMAKLDSERYAAVN